jgi:hypothetical protein
MAGAAAWAAAELAKAAALPLPQLLSLHTGWWQAFWPDGGFLTLDGSRIEAFYYSQLYKFASATRGDRPLHDLEGPWFVDGTDWPDLHWDLNVQQTHYLLLGANRLSLLQSYTNYFATHLQQLVGNVPVYWQYDSAAAPTGASALDGIETCYWNNGPNCTTAPPSVVGNLMWCLQARLFLVPLVASRGGNSASPFADRPPARGVRAEQQHRDGRAVAAAASRRQLLYPPAAVQRERRRAVPPAQHIQVETSFAKFLIDYGNS